MSTAGADGAAAAATYFLDLYDHTYATLDSAALVAMSSAECAFCQSVIDDVARMASEQHSSTGGGHTVVNAFGTEISPAQWYSAAVQLDQQPSAEVDSSGQVVSESPGGAYQMVFALDWATGWKVREVDVTSVPAGAP
jgi:hypothetical protein